MTYLEKRRELKLSGKPEKEKKICKIKPRSKKLAKEQRKYAKLVQVKLSDNPLCKIQIPGVCTTYATGMHHKKRRGKNLLNEEHLIEACDNCNSWLESNHSLGVQMGFLLSKFN